MCTNDWMEDVLFGEQTFFTLMSSLFFIVNDVTIIRVEL
jgi:hypothetical protein